MRLYPETLSRVDKWFAALRVLVIIGGFSWLLLAPIQPGDHLPLLGNFLFFCAYSLVLYLILLRIPQAKRPLYLIALALDLIFLYILIKHSGGLESDFFLAFYLLIALHAFYFGIWTGVVVAVFSTLVYLFAGSFDLASVAPIQMALRLTFCLLVAISMGLLSSKEKSDRLRIEKLNEELEQRRFELQREKEKLTQIIEGIDAGLCLVDRGTHVVWLNNVAESWFGSFDQLQGKMCSHALWGTQELCMSCPSVKSFSKGTVEQAEIEHTSATGQRKFYRLTAAPIRNANGEIVNVLELIQDVTEEKALQMQLVQSSKLAAIGELASGIAHEINNPLGSITVCLDDLSEMLNNGQAPESAAEIPECIRSIKNDIQRCKRITAGLLDFSRKKEPQFEPADLNQLLRTVALFTRHKAGTLRLQLDFKLNPDLPLVMAEADELTQVFLNILINAMDFTPEGKSITVRSERFGPNEVAIEFIDQGVGIPWVNLPKIFSPFFTTKPAGQGTGLGLAISQRIVQRHRGRIEVQSMPGKGTTVTVILPISLAGEPRMDAND